MSQLRIRPACPADAGVLTDLIRSAYRGEDSRAGWTSEADLVEGERINADQVRAMISDAGSLMLVGEAAGQPGRIVGCCQVRNEGAGLAYFGTFAVSPQAQGAGLGRQLMTEAERQAMTAFGATRLEMTVLAPQDKLIAYYERRGFRPTGQTRPFPADPTYARPLVDGLHFVVLEKALR
ncbi:MAG TPA: GNAT family N-acetyltransferase [Streptosporangiaceae bacterium]|nr:GNAT family N-acetyltransferase [Streptosporangiaceae bacterium]